MSLSRAVEAGRALPGRLAAASPVELALRLTLLELLLQPVGEPAVRFALIGAAALGLLFPRALRAPTLWWAIAALTAARVVGDWPFPDNHAYLLCYWCGAVALALTSTDPEEFLAHNGRWLIGLVFLFATLWKTVLAPEFLSGVSMRVTLLVDPRFEAFTRLAGGVTAAWLDAQREFLGAHADGGIAAAAAPMPSARIAILARVATLWTLAWEGVVALCFLWPLGRGLSKLRDLALLVFCATTYAVATVAGFGWLLLAMGVAQCESARWRTRGAYLGVYALVLFFREVPWLDLAAARFAPG